MSGTQTTTPPDISEELATQTPNALVAFLSKPPVPLILSIVGLVLAAMGALGLKYIALTFGALAGLLVGGLLVGYLSVLFNRRSAEEHPDSFNPTQERVGVILGQIATGIGALGTGLVVVILLFASGSMWGIFIPDPTAGAPNWVHLTVNTVLTVLFGIGVAILAFWALDRGADLLPRRIRDKVRPLVYILPAYLAIAVFLLYPAVLTVIYSFQDKFSKNWVGWSNYTTLLSNHAFRETLLNTVLWIAIVPIATVVLGLAIAVLTDRLSPNAEKFSKTIIFLPMAISMVGSATIWKFMYNYDGQAAALGQPQIGLQNAAWQLVGGTPTSWLGQTQFHLNSGWLMLMLLWGQIGFAMVLLSAAVKSVPEDTLEAARIDGAGERQIFFRVVVPQIKGTIVTVFITVTIMVMKVFDIVYVMTNGTSNTNVLGNEFFNQLFTNNDKGHASTIVVLMMAAVIPIMYYQVKHFRAEEAQ